VIRIPLGTKLTLADVLRAVRDDPRPFALSGDWVGSRAIVGSSPTRIVEGPEALEVLTDTSRAGEAVGGGWFGYLGFPLGAVIERLPPAPPRPVPLPDASMAFYDRVYRQDADGEWWFEALDATALPVELGGGPRAYELGDLYARGTARHLDAVADCVQRIAVGELFQANLCLRLEGRFAGSPADAFLTGIETLAPAHGAFIGLEDAAILSFSPEQFLRRDGDVVTTSPIKGTGLDPTKLENSAKDAAEHVMIVDLSRNDLGRVARYGTVAAGERRTEAHPGLFHLVTDVTARVRPDTADADIVRAAFPPGSVTGAPKVQALKVIAALESTQREVYTGAIGFASPHAGLQLNVAIRTLEIAHGDAWMGCGGGIVADSDPRAELEEALTKARPIAKALGARVIADWPRRPDPAEGLLETIAIRDGELIDAHAHLDRLATSARALYDVEIAVEPRPEIAQGRLRILVSPRGSTRVEQREETPDPSPVILEPRALEHGLGPHKWADRTGEPSWLVLDGDDVLETATANVWTMDGGVLTTPPADGRILPLPGTREAHLTLSDLERAQGIFLTSSIRLVTPAGIGEPPSQLAIELAASLRANPAISMKTRSYIR
jgi:para-aminobenzoate synthetase/4-amino-4-deoxychorismate lyase